MKWEEMDGLERCRQFKRLRKLFFEALGQYWDKEFADFKSIEFGNPAIYNGKPKIRIPSIDQSKVTGGYGKPMQIIPDGEWSLICAVRGGKSNGR